MFLGCDNGSKITCRSAERRQWLKKRPSTVNGPIGALEVRLYATKGGTYVLKQMGQGTRMACPLPGGGPSSQYTLKNWSWGSKVMSVKNHNYLAHKEKRSGSRGKRLLESLNLPSRPLRE